MVFSAMHATIVTRTTQQKNVINTKIFMKRFNHVQPPLCTAVAAHISNVISSILLLEALFTICNKPTG